MGSRIFARPEALVKSVQKRRGKRVAGGRMKRENACELKRDEAGGTNSYALLAGLALGWGKWREKGKERNEGN